MKQTCLNVLEQEHILKQSADDIGVTLRINVIKSSNKKLRDTLHMLYYDSNYSGKLLVQYWPATNHFRTLSGQQGTADLCNVLDLVNEEKNSIPYQEVNQS